MRRGTRRAAIAAAAVAIVVGGWLAWRAVSPSRLGASAPPQVKWLVADDAPAGRLVRESLAAVQGNPGSADGWYRLALAYQGCNEATAALRCLEQATELADDHARAWYHLALVRDHHGERHGAVEALARAAAADPTYAATWWRLGDWRLDADDPAGAEQAFAQARRLDPRCVRAATGLARLAARRGDDAATIGLLSPLAAHGVDDSLTHQLLGAALARRGHVADAEAAFARARRQNSPMSDPWQAEVEPFRLGARAQIERAQRLVATGRADQAIPILAPLARADPDNAGLVCNLAAAHRMNGELNRSAEILEAAVRSMPGAWQPHYNLALVRFTAWRGAGASATSEMLRGVVEHVERGIALNPAYAPAHALRGDVHWVLGELAAAEAAYGRAAIADPSNAAWPAQRGGALLRAGRAAEAIAPLRSAIALAPADPSIVALLADALDATGRAEEAAVARDQVAAMTAGMRPVAAGGAPP